MGGAERGLGGQSHPQRGFSCWVDFWAGFGSLLLRYNFRVYKLLHVTELSQALHPPDFRVVLFCESVCVFLSCLNKL